MLRIAPRLIIVLLCGTVMAGCGTTMDIAKLTGGDTAAGHAQKEAAAIDKTQPTDLEGGVRQAQQMRLAGHYDEAIHTLSQLMLVASDDPRVVSEYGKTLAEKGRAQDAVEFLGRAIELSSNDWTLYSAMGVSYDQLGNQLAARTAYEHALALHPEEPSVLNNYALSRMLAGDTAGARQLISRAQLAGGASDAKIASNIAMLNKIAPAPQAAAVVQNAAAPNNNAPPARPAPAPVAAASVATAPVAQNPPHAILPAPPPVAQNMPRPIAPALAVQQPQHAPANTVVMQAVPFDPFAGPVQGSAKAGPMKARAQTPRVAVKTEIAPPKIDIIPDPPAKTADAKAPAPKPVAKAEAAKPGPAKAVPVKAAAKDAIPALRLSANAY